MTVTVASAALTTEVEVTMTAEGAMVVVEAWGKVSVYFLSRKA